MAKRNEVATKKPDAENGTITFTFANGYERTIDMEDIPAMNRTRLVLHGAGQKFGDSYSGAETVTEAIEKFNSVVDAVLAGDWNIGRGATGGIWVDALAEAAKVTREEALEKWNGMDDKTKKKVQKNKDVKKAKLAIELERAKRAAEGAVGGDEDEIDFDNL